MVHIASREKPRPPASKGGDDTKVGIEYSNNIRALHHKLIQIFMLFCGKSISNEKVTRRVHLGR